MGHTDAQEDASDVYQTMKSQKLNTFMDSWKGINFGGMCVFWEVQSFISDLLQAPILQEFCKCPPGDGGNTTDQG